MTEGQPKSMLRQVLRWGALAVGTLIWGSGVASMYGDDYKLATALYLVGIAIIAADFITLEEHGEYRGRKKYAVIGGAVLVAALLFGLSLLWIHLRTADLRAIQVPHQGVPPTPAQSQQSEPSAAAEKKVSPKLRRVPLDVRGQTAHAAARTSGNNSPAVGSITQGPGSALSIGQQGGITAGQITVDAAERLTLSDAGVNNIAQVSRGTCPLQTVSISLNNANDETGKFGAQLKLALERVGMQVNLGSVIAFGANGPIPRGVVLDAGDNCLDLATSIAKALASDKAVSPKRLEVSHVTAADWRDRLVITVSPPN